MSEKIGALNTLIQEKLESDTEFQNQIANLSDTEKEEAIKTKKTELLEDEISNLYEKAEKAGKNEELAKNYKTRAEKAEKELKDLNGDVKDKNPSSITLSHADNLALVKADVHEDDLQEVIDYATFKKIPVKDALKTDFVKDLLSKKTEERKTAEATAKGKGSRPIQKTSVDQIVEDASQGKFPEKGSKEAEELFWARRNGRSK